MATSIESLPISAPDPTNTMSAFSPYTEFSMSPNSPALPTTPGRFQSFSSRTSTDYSRLRPRSMEVEETASSGAVPSPSDIVGPSPVTSNGTETTDIEDDALDNVDEMEPIEEEPGIERDKDQHSPPNMINTDLPPEILMTPAGDPASVIHAPQGFSNFANIQNTNPPQTPPTVERSTPTPFQPLSTNDRVTPSPMSPPQISTDISRAIGIDNVTPRAQTWTEVEQANNDKSRLRSSSASSLEGIPEDYRESDESADFSDNFPQDPNHDVKDLKTALHECWTLCNTLARMSLIHRERIFSYSVAKDSHEKAWKSCWRLCQKLYDARDDIRDLHVGPTLDLCRDFCQALFDVRRRGNDIADGVLRVSFELNNHLFNTHDRNLPEAFRERTLDFYITLCHRLMKQRSELAEETDSLLRACWGLAEMLFSLRQNSRENKPQDEELLGSAVQACWDLCDLFREGWTAVRPERGTPRPSQTTFSQTADQLSRSPHQSHTTSVERPTSAFTSSQPRIFERVKPRHIEPETPTTEFEDTPISPEEQSPSMPNIIVLGTSDASRSQVRWSSNSSNLSGYSQGSAKTSSTIKTAMGNEDVNLTRLKILILKAAMNLGYQRSTSPAHSASNSTSSARNSPPTPTPSASHTSLQSFVKSLPPNAFGKHSALLNSYKELIASDFAFWSERGLPGKGKKCSAWDCAKSVVWMVKAGKFVWLRELYALVFGFGIEEGEAKRGLGITV